MGTMACKTKCEWFLLDSNKTQVSSNIAPAIFIYPTESQRASSTLQHMAMWLDGFLNLQK